MKNNNTILIIFLVFLQACIPLNNVHEIRNYEIKEGKPKARKDSKRYTKFIYTNNSPHQIVIRFLKEKYHEQAYNARVFSTNQKLFLDENIEFNLRFVLYSKQQRYLDLYNLFRNKSSDDYYYNKELDDPYQEGKTFRYVAVTITDGDGVDYLAMNSPFRDRLILYLKKLKREYEVYKSNYYFLNGK